MASPTNIHRSHYTDYQAIFRSIYACMGVKTINVKEAVNLKERKKKYLGCLGERKGEG